MLGMLKALDSAASVMKDPKDILLMDLDNQGRWSILTKDQIDKILRGH
jgi:cellulose biosynthesis protein BcsQ